MAFWFFGKKNNEEIGKLKSNLKYSFSNIKKDMDSVNKMFDNYKEKHDRHLNIGRGEFDFRMISKIIALSNVEHLTLETDRVGDTLDYFVEDTIKMMSSSFPISIRTSVYTFFPSSSEK